LKFLVPRYIVLCLLLVIIHSCKKRPPDTRPEEGIIVYQINYMDETVGGYSSGILPQKMESRFKGGMVKNTIEGALGFFSLINISNIEEMTNTTFLKFIDKKYVYRGKKKEPPCCFGGLEGMEIKFTNSTKQILNYTCQEAIVTFPGTAKESFPVYYTTEINFDDPNATSPFKEIPGILMEFHATLGQTMVIMVAEKFLPVIVPDKEFIIPKHYKEINKNELENILNALLE
jgi:GLPGLI family protein